MFDVINSFVGVTFAWLVIGLMLIPIWAILEAGVNKWVEYSTVGNVSFKSPLRKLWDEYLTPTCNWSKRSWVERNNLEPLVVLFLAVFLINSFAMLVYLDASDLFTDDLSTNVTLIFFTPWVVVGSFLSPVLILGAGMIAFTVVSRKFFRFKEVVDKHMSDKSIHKGE